VSSGSLCTDKTDSKTFLNGSILCGFQIPFKRRCETHTALLAVLSVVNYVKLFTSPASAATANGNMSKYSFTMMKVDGTKSIRQHILWAQNMSKVCLGMNITNVGDKVVLIRQMCVKEKL
jgi:hypothetical protein